MPHSLTKIWIHIIWTPKNREHLIKSESEEKVFDIIRQEFNAIQCYLEIINGMPDHVHCLFRLNAQKSVSEVIKQVKGASSHRINQQKIFNYKFAWQTGYSAFSVSESQIKKVHEYILNQKEHHKKLTTKDELSFFNKLHGLSDEETKNG